MRLAFDTTGPASGLPIALLHGLTNSRERYSGHVVGWLSARGFRVVNIDLRGHGESPWSNIYRVSDYSSDVAELIDTEDLGPTVVVGHSMGGTVAATLAVERPDIVKGLFLEDPVLYESGGDTPQDDSEEADELVEHLRQWQSSGITEGELVVEIGRWPSAHPGKTAQEVAAPRDLAAYARALLSVDPATIDAFVHRETFVERDLWASIAGPVTVLRADPALGAAFLPDHARLLTAVVPQARIVLAEGAAHSVIVDRDGLREYLKALDELLGPIWP